MTFKDLIKKYSKNDVIFTSHAKFRLLDKTFEANFVIDKLFETSKLLYEEYQKERKTYKLIYEHSKDFFFVIIVNLNEKIMIVTFYKTNKKIQKLIKEGGVVYVSKKFKE